MKYYTDTHKIDMIAIIAIGILLIAMLYSAVLKNVTLVVCCFGLVLGILCLLALAIPLYCFIMHTLIVRYGKEYIATITEIGKSEIFYGYHIQESRTLHFDIQLADKIVSVVYAFIEDVQHNVGDNLRVLVYNNRFLFVK